MADFIITWFFKAIVGGFIIAIPVIGHLFILGMALLSIWASGADPNLFQYLWTWDPVMFVPDPVTGEMSEAVIGIVIVMGVGFIIGYAVGDNFKNISHWRNISRWRPSLNIKVPKIPKLSDILKRRKKNRE